MRTGLTFLALFLAFSIIASNVQAQTLRLDDRDRAGIFLTSGRESRGDRNCPPRSWPGHGYKPPYHHPPVFGYHPWHPPVVIVPFPGHPPVVMQPRPGYGVIYPYSGSHIYYRGRNFGLWIDF